MCCMRIYDINIYIIYKQCMVILRSVLEVILLLKIEMKNYGREVFVKL